MRQNKFLLFFTFIFFIQTIFIGNMAFFQEDASIKKIILFVGCLMALLELSPYNCVKS
ncbi:hypothetical protein ERICV_04152 [Paenibacillus larvae subsp. larvae]|uniref:Uncharacterized protein n=1 Tax=Paenibacillus larvae subsp. larvae TaxID=147375 RepID=A0A6C0QXB7_9BACL|nr:hypothetical protein ERICV_04152 [Paenibacillus larvae subsp. larvae]